MPKVKILFHGYVSGENNGHACSTIVLVQDQGFNIIADPGTLPNQNILMEKLSAENLNVDDVNVVFITHSHLDHYRNIGMFPAAKSLDYYGWWIGDTCEDCDGNITDDIKLIKTPGHSYDGITMMVNTNEGKIAICGDIFWKKDFPIDDPYASDKVKLIESREKLLAIADWIIPGHGDMYKVKHYA